MNRNSGFQLGHPVHYIKNNKNSYTIWEYSNKILAAILLFCLLPLFLFIWIYFKIENSGPMFFKQSRPGYKNKPFLIYKIRTMKLGSEQKTTLGTKINNPQVTKFGKILRKLKIDEFPQLINIIRGEMSIAGPRPIPEKLNKELKKHIPEFEIRYSVKPGLTNISQICINENALDEQLIKDWKLRFEGELHYIRNKSVTYDILLIFMTIMYVFKKLKI